VVSGLCIAEETKESSEFKVNAGALEAITTQGENYFMTDIIVMNPQGKPMFEIFPSKAWYRFIKTPKYQINQARIDYQFGESDTFAGAGWADDHNSGIGIRYSPNHWNIKGLDKIDFSAFIIEGQKYQFNVDFNYEFTPGYGIEGHALYLTDEQFKQLLADFELSLWHNWYPDGRLKSYLSLVNNDDEQKIIFGMKAATK